MSTRLLSEPRRPAPGDLDAELTVDAYVTDGTHLFRCAFRWGESIELENCLTLETFAVSLGEAVAAGMWIVKPNDEPASQVP